MLEPSQFENLHRCSGESVSLALDKRHNPKTYFGFAIADLHGNTDTRSRVNAFSNAKRAMHFQTELLADAFGIGITLNRSNRPFPKLLSFIGDCSIVAPRILRKLNKIRNAMEHEYYVPSEPETEDFVDVVELFLAATEYLVTGFPTLVELTSEDEDLHGNSLSYGSLRQAPNQGVITASLSVSTISLSDLHMAARQEKEKLTNEIKAKEKEGIKLLYLDSIEATAYRQVLKSTYQTHSTKVEATNPDEYFKWVSLILSKWK